MEEVGAECGVKAEAIVFWDYSKDFSIRRRWFCRLGEVPPSDLLAVLAGAISFAGMARCCDKKPDLPRQPRKVELSTRAFTCRGLPQGPLYIFPGAGTLRKNASAN